ncbi:MAG: hypothetical protein P8O05_05935, partial [Flavobacteriales bacterium]|nr:hypothetical protein [Flavobacteriales bacterium]
MKRYHNIDPLFNQARRLPVEVNIEQVQGFLATSALPAGASKSWFNSFNFYLMTGLITGSIALYIAFSSGINTTAEIAETNAIPPSNEQTVFAGIMAEAENSSTEMNEIEMKEDGEIYQQYSSEMEDEIQSDIQTQEEPDLSAETPTPQRHEDTPVEGEPLFAFANPEWEDYYYLSPHDMVGAAPDEVNTSRKIRFLIAADDLTGQVRGTLGKAREYNVRVSEIKQKRKRNGNLKHLKVAFAVPHEKPNCGWKSFRTVDLKGFKTYEYGWTIDAEGNITDFWDKLNNKEPSEVA